MSHCDLRQKDLAELLGVTLQRVKRLSGGEAQKLTPQESEALVTKLRIRPDWIVGGGQGRMFMTQHEHAAWLAAHALPEPVLREIRQLEQRRPAWPEGGAPHGAAEVELLANWRRCNRRDRQTVSELAARLAGDEE